MVKQFKRGCECILNRQMSKRYQVQVPGCCWKGLQGSLCEKQLGLPCAGHSRAQQGTPEPLSQEGGPSGKTNLTKDKNAAQQLWERRTRKKNEKQFC